MNARKANLSSLITSIAKCVKSNSLRSGELKFFKEDEKLCFKFFNDKNAKGEISIELSGIDDDFPGTPYYSNWKGLFYRLPVNRKKPFVKNGQFVRRGQPVGIVFINKNEQFILNSPSDGLINFPQGDIQIEHATAISVYDEKNPDAPMFYLK